MRAPLSDKFGNRWRGGWGRTGRRLSVIEQCVEVSDSRSSRAGRGRDPVLYRYADLLGVGIVGGIDIHGITVILRLKKKS